MLLFLVGLALLGIGYLTYGRFVEKLLAPDDRPTPAHTRYDGVDFVVLPHWKNMLIQLLNIAGIGPVIGVILGIKFGVVAFLIIPVGNIIGGSVHDFVSGMMSLRNGGSNLPRLIRMNLGKYYYAFFSVFMILLLLLVVAVFINVPAKLIDGMVPDHSVLWLAIGCIFVYYVCATLFPVDKIIGNIYPVFGAVLILSTAAILAVLLKDAFLKPELLTETANFRQGMSKQPLVPVLFVTIACGILSGFHATQSPIIARTMNSERNARQAFYGMMVVEGVIAMIWAGAALAIYNLFPEYMSMDANSVLSKITSHFLGKWVGGFTVVGVVILAITSGDTAMRSLRLSLSEMISLPQNKIMNRLLLCLPLILAVSLLLWWSNISAKTFGQLWNYFAWGNQVLAASTLLACSVWLRTLGRKPWVTLLPGTFMTFVVLSYILWISPAHGGPVGLNQPLHRAYVIAAVLSLALASWTFRHRPSDKLPDGTDGIPAPEHE